MNPYVRPLESGAPLPDGWATEPAGQWQGNEVEVAYDPARHDVMLVRGTDGDDIDGRLAQIGYEFIATDGQSWLWYRDRLAAARTTLERGHHVPTTPAKGLTP